MKINKLYTLLLIATLLLSVVQVSRAQKNIEVLPTEIDSIWLSFMDDKGNAPEGIPMVLRGASFRIQVHVQTVEGEELMTPLKGKEGLKKKQFQFEVRGANRLKMGAIPTDFYQVPRGLGDVLFMDGLPGVEVTCFHKEGPAKKVTVFLPLKRPRLFAFAFYSTGPLQLFGLRTEVDVTYEEDYPEFPLRVKINVPGYEHLNKDIRLDPSKETLQILANGKDGPDATESRRAENGGYGGDVNIRFYGKAKAYEGVFQYSLEGGRGGNGNYLYGAGRSGKDGKVYKMYLE